MTVIEQLYSNTEFNTYINSINPIDLQQDIKNDVLLALACMDRDKLDRIVSDGKLPNYAIRSAKLMLYDNSGRLKKKYYTAPITAVVVESKDDIDISFLTDIQKEYISALAKCNGNKRELSKLTNIPYRHILDIFEEIKSDGELHHHGKETTASVTLTVKYLGNIDNLVDKLESISRQLQALNIKGVKFNECKLK